MVDQIVGEPERVEIDVDLRDVSPKDKRKRVRKWKKITGITLHQTGIHGFGERAWKKVTAHLGVHSDGRVYLIHPLESYLWASNSLNRDTIAIEVAGNFLGDLDRPKSYWKKGGGPSELTPEMIAGLRRAVRYIIQEVAAAGGSIGHIYAHRQGRGAKSNCPGAAIWQSVGVWAQTELGLGNGPGLEYVRKDGKPIPPAWDPRLLEEPLDFSDDRYAIDWGSMGSEDGEEAPDEDELFFVDEGAREVASTSVRVRGLPRGMAMVDAAAQEEPGITSRGSFDLSGPLDLDGPIDDPLAGILDGLAGGGLSIVDTLRLGPAEEEAGGGPTRGLGEGPMELDGGDALEFEIDLEEDEDAVVLLEENGVFRWILPTPGDAEGEGEGEGARVRSAGAGRARFSIAMRPPVAGDGEEQPEQTRGLFNDLISGAVTARVYKFFADKIAAELVDYGLSRVDDILEGPVLIRGPEIRDWVNVDDLTQLEVPSDRPARVLLMIHGTFSSTRGSFGGLCEGTGQAVLQGMLRSYDVIVGVDHRTLSRAPRENAGMIRDLLLEAPWGEGPVLDVICFSRGGLVARELIERLLPVSDFSGRVRRTVFVATTNAGTELARPENWNDLVDTYTTLACNAMRAVGAVGGWLMGVIGGELVNGIGAFVKALAGRGITDGMVPGLAAMNPSGEVVRVLNASPLPERDGEAPLYYRITSQFSAEADLIGSLRGGLVDGAKAFIADRITGKLYKGIASDLVVHNPSTDTLHPDLRYSGNLHFGANPAVYHVNFFLQEPVHRQLMTWLELEEVGESAEALEVEIDLAFGITQELVDDVFDGLAFSGRSFEDEEGDEGPDGEGELVDLHLRAAVPAEVAAGAVFRVDVELARAALAEAGGAGEAVATALADLGELVELEVVPRRGVRTVEHRPVSLRMPAKGAKIGLFVELIGDEAGDAEVWVLARQGGRAIARMVLGLAIVEAGAETSTSVAEVEAQAGSTDGGAAASLEVIELREATGLRYRFHLRAPELGLAHRFESPLIHGAAEDVISGLYARIEGEWKQSGGSPKRFDRRLRAVGVQLGEQLLPEGLRALLWEHRAGLDGLTLLSDEGHIPWELVHLKHPDKPLKRGEAGFLAELGMVRAVWGAAPARTITIREGRAFTVVPDYPVKALALPSAAHERDWLASQIATAAIEPNPEALLERLEEPGAIDLLHIAAHGEVADRDAWLILEGDIRSVGEGSGARRKWFPARLSAAEVAASADLRGPDGAQPLVFLNACKVARGEHLLSGFAGWVPSFMGAGAGALVAPLWSVGDGAAMRFAEGFYTALLQGATFSAAAKLARERARKLGDPTWLAYVVYASAQGRVQRANEGEAS